MASISDDKIYSMFDNGIKNSLSEIYFETTFMNYEQFQGIGKIISKVMLANPDKTLIVHIFSDADELPALDFDLPDNITIDFHGNGQTNLIIE